MIGIFFKREVDSRYVDGIPADIANWISKGSFYNSIANISKMFYNKSEIQRNKIYLPTPIHAGGDGK